MLDIPELVAGHDRYRAGRFSGDAGLLRDLAAHGQSPKTMLIACSDSRVDPAAIFDARPGDLFLYRNVANLVPPNCPPNCCPDDIQHTAALAFAVTGLEVEAILVLGHSDCGGVKTFLAASAVPPPASDPRSAIHAWVSQLGPIADSLPPGGPAAERQRAAEYAGIRLTLANLMTYPFIAERVAAGRLKLRGAHFCIATGNLTGLDP